MTLMFCLRSLPINDYRIILRFRNIASIYENDEIMRRVLPLFLEKVGGRFKENETFSHFSWTIGHAILMHFGKISH